tara:strand:+ start:18472 stop:18612 length:141 start_codon:yes stop_codon:yes gene_type:complete
MKTQTHKCQATECQKEVVLKDFNLETNMCDTCSETYFLNSFENCIK